MKIFLLLFFTLFLFSFFIIKYKQKEYHPYEGELLVNHLLSETAKIIKEKYNLNPCGTGAAMPGGPIQEVTLCFDTELPYTKDQLRELLIKSAEKLLNNVNKNRKIYQFLKNQPFTIRNVEIIIYNNDKNGLEMFDPAISVARISQGKLIYRTTDINDPLKYKNEYEESYEEALSLFKNSSAL